MNEKKKLNDSFLEYILKAHYCDDKYDLCWLINFDAVKQAADLLQTHYESFDQLSFSNHACNIQKIFCTNVKITKKNCPSTLGISFKTYFRYKQQYLSTFKNYLIHNRNLVNYIPKVN